MGSGKISREPFLKSVKITFFSQTLILYQLFIFCRLYLWYLDYDNMETCIQQP